MSELRTALEALGVLEDVEYVYLPQILWDRQKGGSNKCRNNGLPILEYMLEAQRPDGWTRVYQGHQTSHALTLNASTATMYRVRARNELGWSTERNLSMTGDG